MNIAFVPVRGGSKSIPLKNIKDFCGKPLVYWTVSALQKTNEVDRIVVATDSAQIKQAVIDFGFSKVEVYDRKPENAIDTASTESVMLEYINAANLPDETVFILVQATSPLTQAKDFSGGLKMYSSGEYNSILTCVRNYRFYWNDDGTPNNYDYKKRPRRQDFHGTYMENGAFYISTVKNVKKSGNRLSGKIGIYEMPEYTAVEIDEPDDWNILENLMQQHVLHEHLKMPEIKMFLTDCDGCLTDGGMYYSEKGDELKKFNTKDGMGFKLLREAGIITGVITGERRELNKTRAKKLKLDILEQGVNDKLAVVKWLCIKYKITPDNIAFVGDDINDLDAMEYCGIKGCPATAVQQVKNISNYICSVPGGMGAVREFIDWLIEKKIIVVNK